VRESRPRGSVRGALSNERPYREKRRPGDWMIVCSPQTWQAFMTLRDNQSEPARQSAFFSTSLGVACAGGRPRPRLRSRAALRR